MALVLADRVRETTTTTGTGAVTLGGAYTGFQTFSAGIGNGNTTYYTIANVVTGEWEVGIGTYTSASNTLSRDTVLASSNANALVNFVAGSKDVFVTQPAERAVYINSANTQVSVPQLAATSITDSGNLTFTGTGNRITGDFSNATVANRVMFQTSTVNSNTLLGVIPNGTALTSFLSLYNNSDPTNSSILELSNQRLSGEARIASSIAGTGTYLPMTFYTNGVEQLRLTTGGALQFSQTGMRITGDFSNATFANRVAFQSSTTNGITNIAVIPNGTAANSFTTYFSNSDPTNASTATIGIVGATDVRFTSGITGTGTYLPMTFYTGGSERMRLDTSGRMLIGSTSARANLFNSTSTAPLQVEGTTADNSTVLAVRNTDTAAAGPFYILARARGTTVGSTTVVQSGDVAGTLSFQASDGSEFVETARIQSLVDGTPGANDMPGTLLFSTTADGAASSTERMRIDSSGNVGIGTTTTTINDQIGSTRPLVVAASDAGTTVGGFIPSLNVVNTNTTTNNGAQINFASTYTSGGINTSSAYIATIFGARTNTSNYYASGALVFGTNAGGVSTGPTERMRIDSSGNLLVGGTGVIYYSKTLSQFDGSSKYGYTANDTSGVASVGFVAFAVNGTTTTGAIGTITRNGSSNAVLYNTTSDQRLKENIADADAALGVVGAIKVRKYDWKEGGQHENFGFVAQELAQVVDNVVSKGRTEEDMWSLDYGKLTPLLVKAIQEQQALITQLTERISALEGK